MVERRRFESRLGLRPGRPRVELDETQRLGAVGVLAHGEQLHRSLRRRCRTRRPQVGRRTGEAAQWCDPTPRRLERPAGVLRGALEDVHLVAFPGACEHGEPPGRCRCGADAVHVAPLPLGTTWVGAERGAGTAGVDRARAVVRRECAGRGGARTQCGNHDAGVAAQGRDILRDDSVPEVRAARGPRHPSLPQELTLLLRRRVRGVELPG